MSWTSDQPPPHTKLGPRDWARVVRRAVPMAVLVFGGLGVLMTVRMVEAPLHGRHRPWTPRITRTVCRGALRLMGLRRTAIGDMMQGHGGLVSNHVSWLDIFVLNAGGCVTFVSKAEVAGWPGIGWLARATGTLFIARTRGEAASHVASIRARLEDGQTLVFFPEGTSSDGQQVLPFKPTLFAPFVATGMALQSVTLSYRAPAGADPRTYGWWGDMDFAPHLLATLAVPRHGQVVVTYHPVVPSDLQTDRKALARALQEQVASAL